MGRCERRREIKVKRINKFIRSRNEALRVYEEKFWCIAVEGKAGERVLN
jgi:hypothetical protein